VTSGTRSPSAGAGPAADPRGRPGARSASLLDTSGTARAVVCETGDGTCVQMSPSAFWLYRQLRDGRSPAEIAGLIAGRFGQQPGEHEVSAACAAVLAQVDAAGQAARRAARRRYALRIRILPEPVVGRIARRLQGVFSRPGAVAYAVLLAAATVAATASGSLGGAAAHGAVAGFAVAYGLYLLALCAHELGHAAACSRYGLAPGDIGFALYLFVLPAVYCDVTRVWLLPRRQRVTVDLAGVLFETAAAAVYLVAGASTGAWPLNLAGGLVAGNLLWVLNPFGRFDAYWALSDALGVTSLRRDSMRALRASLGRRGRAAGADPGLPAAVRSALAAYAVALALAVTWLAYFGARSLPGLTAGLWATAGQGIRAAARGQAGAALSAGWHLAVPLLVLAVLYCYAAGLLVAGVRGLARRRRDESEPVARAD
jgi:hypothetical protein